MLIFFQNAFAQSDSLKHHKTYLGVNILRIAAADLEIQVLHSFSNRLMFGFCAGYDFNILNKKTFKLFGTLDSTKPMESIEQTGYPIDRYYQGRGPVFRFNFDFNLQPANHKQWFFSVEALFKIRNYHDRFYGSGRILHLESANQQISGLTLYSGINHYNKKNTNITRVYWGMGFRVLKSDITWQDYFYDATYFPEKKFSHTLVIPSIHFGMALLSKPQRLNSK